jgi:2-polyprenyl-3-methyl-5-hydroxy-6-metoxy-1,4-benzoquinol methylase
MPDQMTGMLSPFLRNRRLAAARPHLGSGPVLDMGCGTGLLAAGIPADRYLGVDLDADTIAIARRTYPQHRFQTLAEFEALPPVERFSTVVALAVIEHVPSPEEWLRTMATFLEPGGRIVLTTPHPRYRRVHEFGAALGIFSREGAEEHHILLDNAIMARTAAGAGLEIQHRHRFLLGANQLFVLRPTGC